MPDPLAFWSYVRADDEDDGGRIARLAHDVSRQFQMQTGDPVEIFLDTDAVHWGDVWRQRIDDALSQVAFFVAVLTPRYFLRAECRRELQYFAQRAEDLGLRELVLPLLYVDVRALHEEAPEDDLLSLVRTFHWSDWTDLRFAEPESEAYRRSVSGLAARLVEASQTSETSQVLGPRREQIQEQDADEPGFMDVLGDMETALTDATETMNEAGRQMESIGAIMRSGSEQLENADPAHGFAARLSVARQVAQELQHPAEAMYDLGKQFNSQLIRIDAGLRVMIERLPQEAEESKEAREQACEFFETVRGSVQLVDEGLGAITGFLETLPGLESATRQLRPPLRRLRDGLTLMLEARALMNEWVHLVDSSALRCE